MLRAEFVTNSVRLLRTVTDLFLGVSDLQIPLGLLGTESLRP